MVVVPTFNNARSLPGVLGGLGTIGLPVIVVNDGSTDDTAATVDAWREGDSASRHSVTHHENRGKAAALLTGFAMAREMGFTHALTIDSDGQHEPTDLRRLIGVGVGNSGALIVGARPQRIADCPWRSLVGRRLSNWFVWVASGVHVTDSQSGMRLYPLGLIGGLGVRAGRYAFETEILTRAGWAGLGVIETPITGIYGVAGGRTTHFRVGRDSWEAVGMHTRLIARSLLPGDPVPRVDVGSCGAATAQVNHSIGTILHRAWWWLGPRRLAAMATGNAMERGRLAASVGTGLFMATVPVYGIKTVACLWLSAKFRLHPAVVIAVSSLSTPPLGFVFAFLSLLVGHVILRGDLPTPDVLPTWSAFTLADARALLWEWVVGSVIVGVVLGVLGYTLAALALRVRGPGTVRGG